MEVRRWARGHVGALTAVLSAAAVAVVFAAALQAIPVGELPRPTRLLEAIPHLNAAISVAAVGTILAGVRAIRRGDVGRHRRLMLASFALFVAFLSLYLYRVALLGPTEFGGPDVVRTFVYLPVLVVHVTLAVVCVPFVFHALLLAWTHPVADLYGTSHRRVGLVAATLWLVSYVLGVCIYALLYVVY